MTNVVEQAEAYAKWVEMQGEEFVAIVDHANSSSYVKVMLHPLTKAGKRRRNRRADATAVKVRFSDHAQYYGATVSVDPTTSNTIETAKAVFHTAFQGGEAFYVDVTENALERGRVLRGRRLIDHRYRQHSGWQAHERISA